MIINLIVQFVQVINLIKIINMFICNKYAIVINLYIIIVLVDLQLELHY